MNLQQAALGIQWGAKDFQLRPCCPLCRALETQGHNLDCVVGLALKIKPLTPRHLEGLQHVIETADQQPVDYPGRRELDDLAVEALELLRGGSKPECTAEPADLNKLQRYDPDIKWRGCMDEDAEGEYVKLCDVQALLATHQPSAAAPVDLILQACSAFPSDCPWSDVNQELYDSLAKNPSYKVRAVVLATHQPSAQAEGNHG